MRTNLKVAIWNSGRSQRVVGLDARIAESRMSELVRGMSDPTPAERDALTRVLGRDYFDEEAVGASQ
jgi:hypothetical protein